MAPGFDALAFVAALIAAAIEFAIDPNYFDVERFLTIAAVIYALLGGTNAIL
jgi:hypothetical protein